MARAVHSRYEAATSSASQRSALGGSVSHEAMESMRLPGAGDSSAIPGHRPGLGVFAFPVPFVFWV